MPDNFIPEKYRPKFSTLQDSRLKSELIRVVEEIYNYYDYQLKTIRESLNTNTSVIDTRLRQFDNLVAGLGKRDITSNISDTIIEEINVPTDISDAIANHVAQSDPHTQYQKESEKNSNSGYAGLDSSGKVFVGRLPAQEDSGMPTTTHFPANGDWGLYVDIDVGSVFIAANSGGAIVTIELI